MAPGQKFYLSVGERDGNFVTKKALSRVGIIKVYFGPLVNQLVWHVLPQLFTSMSVKIGRYLSRRFAAR